MTRREVPAACDVRGRAPRLGDDLLRDKQTQLDPDARESDPLTARLRAGRDVVVSRQLPALHAASVVDDRQRRVGGARAQLNDARAAIERVGHDLGQDGLFERPV